MMKDDRAIRLYGDRTLSKFLEFLLPNSDQTVVGFLALPWRLVTSFALLKF